MQTSGKDSDSTQPGAQANTQPGKQPDAQAIPQSGTQPAKHPDGTRDDTRSGAHEREAGKAVDSRHGANSAAGHQARNGATVLTQRHGRVGLLTLNRPAALNALNDALMDELGAALRTFDADPDIGAIVLTGSDKAFAAGADIGAMANHDHMDVFKADFVTRNWETLRSVRKPVIAVVAGFALGGGCELAMMCDIIIAADTARFGQPEVKLGIMPGAGGTQRLARAVSKAKAMDLCLSARIMTADEAERAGLVSRVVPAAALFEEAMATARTIAGFSLPAVMMIKEAVNAAYETTLAQGVLFERRQFHSLFGTEDQKEGMAAFLEKRQPVFKHR